MAVVGTDPPEIRGRPSAVWEGKRQEYRTAPTGVMASASLQAMDDVATREALLVVSTHQPEARKGQAGESAP